ncbi:MAG: hypothetical protein JXA53_02750 [Bacteroidales bacterium]|nr:hypothetical protein [Bacteroidales bacterium]
MFALINLTGITHDDINTCQVSCFGVGENVIPQKCGITFSPKIDSLQI